MILRPPRALVGTIILAGCSLVPLVQMCASTAREPWRIGGDEVTRHEQRLAKLREALPPGESAVGYVSDRQVTPADMAALKEFVLTVYALTPVRVDLDIRHRYVVGSFGDGQPRRPDGTRLVVLEDFGDGVYLLRGEGG